MGSLETKKALQRSSNIKVGIAIGIMLLIFPVAMIGGGSDAVALLIIPLVIAAVVFWYWGLSEYARSKGYPSYLGLVGLLGIIGLLVLLILPDTYKVQPPPVLSDGAYPRPAPGSVTTIV